jgi:hypothetical protein
VQVGLQHHRRTRPDPSGGAALGGWGKTSRHVVSGCEPPDHPPSWTGRGRGGHCGARYACRCARAPRHRSTRPRSARGRSFLLRRGHDHRYQRLSTSSTSSMADWSRAIACECGCVVLAAGHPVPSQDFYLLLRVVPSHDVTSQHGPFRSGFALAQRQECSDSRYESQFGGLRGGPLSRP